MTGRSIRQKRGLFERSPIMDVEIDLTVGDRYRIGNQFPDGRILWISGEFESIEAPHRLVYTWTVEPNAGSPERITVQFEPRDGATEVIVRHDRTPDDTTRKSHEAGWLRCLDGLVGYAIKASS